MLSLSLLWCVELNPISCGINHFLLMVECWGILNNIHLHTISTDMINCWSILNQIWITCWSIHNNKIDYWELLNIIWIKMKLYFLLSRTILVTVEIMRAAQHAQQASLAVTLEYLTGRADRANRTSKLLKTIQSKRTKLAILAYKLPRTTF